LVQALEYAVPGTFEYLELSTGDPASELLAGCERHEAILSAVMHLNRHRQTGQPRPGRMTCAGEELHDQAALIGRLLEHRCDGGPRARRPGAPRGTRTPAASVVDDDHVMAGGEKAPHGRRPKATVGPQSHHQQDRRCTLRLEGPMRGRISFRSEEHTSELQSLRHLVCRLLL